MQDYLCPISGRDEQRRAQIKRFGERTRYCAQIKAQTCRHNTNLLEGVSSSNSRLFSARLGSSRLSIVVERCCCCAAASSSPACFFRTPDRDDLETKQRSCTRKIVFTILCNTMQVPVSDQWRMQLFKYLFSLSGNTFVFSPLGSRRPLQESRRHPALTLHPNKMFAGNRLQSPQHIHQSGLDWSVSSRI